MTDEPDAELIRALSNGLMPVAVLPPVRSRAWRYAALSLAAVAGVIAIVGLRRDIGLAIHQGRFLWQVALLAAVSGVAAVAALRLSVPGADQAGLRLAAPLALAVWPMALLLPYLAGGGSWLQLAGEPLHLSCARTIGLASTIPALTVWLMLRRGVPLAMGWTAVMAGTSAAAVGALAVSLSCPLQRAPHLLVAHVLPSAVAVAVIALAGLPAIRRRVPAVAWLIAIAVVPLASSGAVSAQAPATFTVVKSTTGYIASDELLAFLPSTATSPSHMPLTGGLLVIAAAILLPWAFARAGLATRPKPAALMRRVKMMPRVKVVLGVCILLTAVYFGSQAVRPFLPNGIRSGVSDDGWYDSLDAGIAAAKREGKPIFLDVWATWCRNCVVMNATTFKDANVTAALDGYVKVRFQAEDVEKPEAAAVLDQLDSVGLPTYAVLTPASE